jgi:hypothetical protein
MSRVHCSLSMSSYVSEQICELFVNVPQCPVVQDRGLSSLISRHEEEQHDAKRIFFIQNLHGQN